MRIRHNSSLSRGRAAMMRGQLLVLSLIFATSLCAPLPLRRTSPTAETLVAMPPQMNNALAHSSMRASDTDVTKKARAGESYGKLPMTFEVNAGQTDARVKFIARGAGYSLYLTPTESVFVMSRQHGEPKEESREQLTKENQVNARRARRPTVAAKTARAKQATLRMKLVGADAQAAVAGADELAGKVNYFVGSDPQKWHANVQTYGRVRSAGVYPGVDMIYYGDGRQLEYDFRVAPGADPRQIALSFDGVQKVEVEAASGDLLLHTPLGVMRQHQPQVYQEVGGRRREIASRYVKRANGEIGFDVADYDRAQPLVIDPVLVYSTFLGGSGQDFAAGIAVDAQGNAYIAGNTPSTNFPVKNPFQATFGGNINGDAFVTKLNAMGDALVYSTYLGGNGSDGATGIAVDAQGSAYVTGYTTSTNFPVMNAFQATYGGQFSSFVSFVTKLNATGDALSYSTYFGADNTSNAIAVDAQGNACITGLTYSGGITTKNPFQSKYAGGTPGSGHDGDAYITKFNPTGDALVYSTYLGGGLRDYASGIAVDSQGNVYVTGYTQSFDFPVKNPLQANYKAQGDAFVTELNAAGSALVRTSPCTRSMT